MSSDDKQGYVTQRNDHMAVDEDDNAEGAPIEEVADEQTENPESDPDRNAQIGENDADDAEAIDKSNIIKDRTRDAAPKEGYREPGDEEGLEA